MSPFRLREDARKWFSDIRANFTADFDSYYFCLMAGIACGRKETVPQQDTAELVDNFPGRFRNRGKMLVTLFLSKELQLLGIDTSEKAAMHAAISRLVLPGSPSSLSEAGVKEFNRYANGGFEVLLDWFDEKPRSLEAFLPLFKRQLDIHQSKQFC